MSKTQDRPLIEMSTVALKAVMDERDLNSHKLHLMAKDLSAPGIRHCMGNYSENKTNFKIETMKKIGAALKILWLINPGYEKQMTWSKQNLAKLFKADKSLFKDSVEACGLTKQGAYNILYGKTLSTKETITKIGDYFKISFTI